VRRGRKPGSERRSSGSRTCKDRSHAVPQLASAGIAYLKVTAVDRRAPFDRGAQQHGAVGSGSAASRPACKGGCSTCGAINIGRQSAAWRFVVVELDALFRAETPKIGMWLDTSDQTVEETVDEVLARVWTTAAV
jgi:hypothetical protein